MMKILFITHDDNFYGSSRSLLGLIQGLQLSGFQSFVALPSVNDFTLNLSKQNIQPFIIKIPLWMTKKPLSFKNYIKTFVKIILTVFKLQNIVKTSKIDVIYTNSSVTPVGRLTAFVCKKPHIWHIREFGELDHSLKFIFPKNICQALINSSSAVVFNSFAVRNFYRNSITNHVNIVYNGIEFSKEFDMLMNIRKNTPHNGVYKFMIIGALQPKKGQLTAIKALSEVHRRGYLCKLLIVGSGLPDYLEKCAKLVETLRLENFVEFKGFVQNPYEIYFESDCLLMCSEAEAFGRVTVEAMATGLPVIGRNSGGTPEIIKHENTGLLYNTFDELVASMIRLVENPAVGREMGNNGWHSAKEHFTIEEYAINISRIINSVTHID